MTSSNTGWIGAAVMVAGLGVLPGTALAEYPAAAGFQENFGDWMVNCDETLRCDVAGFGSGAQTYFRLMLERTGEPDAPVTLIFDSGDLPGVGGTVRFAVPALDYAMFGKVRHAAENGMIRFPGLKPDHALIRAMIDGTAGTATLEMPDGAARSVAVPLNGVTQALLYMDNHQGRIDRTDAIIARGGQAADSGLNRIALAIDTDTGDAGEEDVVEEGGFEQAPADSGDDGLAQAPETGGLPANRVPIEGQETLNSVALIPQAVRTAIEDGPGCELDRTVDALGMTRYFISDTFWLWEVPCYIAAYQATWVYVTASNWDGTLYATVMPFYPPPTQEGTEDPEIISPTFSAATSTLTSFAKGRGAGDCGTWQRYELVYGDGENIEWNLLEQREKVDCDGRADPPESYPLVWKAD
ncbi:MAG: DUF1176 domain-containing protein [Rhodobiaceae bacterium]|nr:DUF1176 domain-containing protein [Rhodobiaceae bacterium]